MTAIVCFGRTKPGAGFRAAAASLGIELLTVNGDSSRPVDAALDTIAEGRPVVTVPFGCGARDLDALLRHPDLIVRPNLATIRLSHDPLAARYFLHDAGYDVAEFEEVDQGDTWAVTRFSRRHGWPVRLGTPRWAGTRNVHLVRPYTELEQVWESDTNLWLLEACEPLAPQISVVLTRRPSGDRQTLSVTASTQDDFQPHRTVQLPGPVATRAVGVASQLADELDSVGLLRVTFVHTRAGRLVIDDLTYGVTETHSIATPTPGPKSLVVAHLRALVDLPPVGHREVSTTARRSGATT